jgi:hypothetical protein
LSEVSCGEHILRHERERRQEHAQEHGQAAKVLGKAMAIDWLG